MACFGLCCDFRGLTELVNTNENSLGILTFASVEMPIAGPSLRVRRCVHSEARKQGGEVARHSKGGRKRDIERERDRQTDRQAGYIYIYFYLYIDIDIDKDR